MNNDNPLNDSAVNERCPSCGVPLDAPHRLECDVQICGECGESRAWYRCSRNAAELATMGARR
jgi:hypothetical protein